MHFAGVRAVLKSSPSARLFLSHDAPFVLDFLHRQFKTDVRPNIPRSALCAALANYREEVCDLDRRALCDEPQACLDAWCSDETPWLRLVESDGQDEPLCQLTAHAETLLDFVRNASNGERRVPLSPVDQASHIVRQQFALATDFCPFYPSFRTLLPPDYSREGLIVPLDHGDVVSAEKDRSDYDELARRFTRELPAYRTFLEWIKPFQTKEGVLAAESDGVTPYWANDYFGVADAMALTGIVGASRPRRYVEIGSGHSTRFCHRARTIFDIGIEMTCIDPVPRVEIAAIADEVIPRSLVEVDADLFSKLDAGDILFLDGSHLAFRGSDVPYFFLRVLPVLAPGVTVHVHDIFLPHEYPQRCDHLQWNEQYVLAAFLLCNRSWQVLLPVQFCYRQGLLSEGVSFWMQRTAVDGGR